MYSSNRIDRHCPICGNIDTQSLCEIHLAPVAGENLPPDFHVVRCAHCGFCFDDLMACQDDFDRYYADCIKYQHPQTLGSGGLSAAEYKRYERMFAPCKKYIKDDSFLLDIGAGKGGFLQYISLSGDRVYAVEPSMSLIKEHNGIKFFGNIDNIIEKHIKFDIIFCTHVLEHIYDLHTFIEKMKCVASENTIFYIEVPNAAAYINGHKAPFYYFDREHINHFTPDSLKNLFALHGFKDVWYEYSGNIAVIFQKSAERNIFALTCDDTYSENILAYIEQSKTLDAANSYENIVHPVVLWGFGAYLRRIFLKPDFPKPVAAIIDRDRGGQGQIWNDIPLVTADILAEEAFSRSTVLITSVLYAEEVRRQLEEEDFQGTVLTAF